MDIPVHHDTGYWVKHTHRVHVAIETGELVDFLVGPTEEHMTKFLFDEGRVVELNNQAKHAVTNNMETWRVHLIFDYVDDHPVNRIIVNPSEKIIQTRRSIDLEREAGSGKKLPSFIVIGAQKSGTTSLYEYICQHPLMLKGKRRETHFFDWRWPEGAGSMSTESLYDHYATYFNKQALFQHASLVTGESTPSYLFHSNVVLPRIQAICPWTKLLVILRNPVARAYSQYQMCVSHDGDPQQREIRGMSSYIGRSFDEVVQIEIDELRRCNITPTSSCADFQRLVVSTRPMGHGGHSVIARGLYALQLIPYIEAFTADQLKVMSINDIKGDRGKVQTVMDSVFDFIGIPTHDLVI